MANLDRSSRRNLIELVGDAFSYSTVSALRRRASRHGEFQHIVVPIDDMIGLRVAATGRFELTQFDAIRTVLEYPQEELGVNIDRTGTFVDVGANIGLYTIAFSRFFGRTLAFEPNPVTFKVLEANIALSDVRTARTFNEALSDKSGEASIFVPLNGNLGWATMDPQHHRIPVSETRISTRTLDEVLAAESEGPGNSISLMKIDVEGHEPEVLRGAQKILQRDGPVILFEVLSTSAGGVCIEILRNCGYQRFFTFKRELGGRQGGIAGYLDSIINGVPVIISEIDVSTVSRSALVCAVRS